eukprot:TRINITY_DN1934_c0_g1_i1.p1 TRINITY_DN1934_c0_g1~~TRINITY_DN1934_c0_g1_i1.p1  ORF type:complete len:603 (-),score=131.06 TRINITY_DN1934_c0_g1_i1:102-1910(-)
MSSQPESKISGIPQQQDAKAEAEGPPSSKLKLKLVTGAYFQKHGRKGNPHKRYVCCSEDLTTVRWGKTPQEAANASNDAFIYSGGIIQVARGCTTAVFKRQNWKDEKQKALSEGVSFSVIHRDRTLDLECETEASCREWVEAFLYLKDHAEKASKPFNVKHVTHVDKNFEWKGANLRSEFELAGLIGEGAFGQVFRAVHKSSKCEMAIKMLFCSDKAMLADIVAEVNILKECRNPSIVNFFGCWGPDEQHRLWILMELCSKGALMSLCKRIDMLPNESQIAYICASVLKALVYLHTSKKIFHRDIKAQNILMTGTGEVKVTDFGISKKIQTLKKPKFEVQSGSPLWMAPEMILGVDCSFKADVWSLGVTAIELAEGEAPHFHLPPFKVMSEIVRGSAPTLRHPELFSKDLNDFISKCVEKEISKRPSAMELLLHPFVRNATDKQVLRPFYDDVYRDAIKTKLTNKSYKQALEELKLFVLSSSASTSSVSSASSPSSLSSSSSSLSDSTSTSTSIAVTLHDDDSHGTTLSVVPAVSSNLPFLRDFEPQSEQTQTITSSTASSSSSQTSASASASISESTSQTPLLPKAPHQPSTSNDCCCSVQ